jgi:hypothetical protein
MKKDIPIKKVTDIAVAVVPNVEDLNFWDVYLLNLKNYNINNVFISSSGYGEINGEKVQTTQLRYFYEIIGPEMAVKIEPLDSELFKLANEYWVSFQCDNFMYDKKYVFVKGSFMEVNFTTIPIVKRKGIMIK